MFFYDIFYRYLRPQIVDKLVHHYSLWFVLHENFPSIWRICARNQSIFDEHRDNLEIFYLPVIPHIPRYDLWLLTSPNFWTINQNGQHVVHWWSAYMPPCNQNSPPCFFTIFAATVHPALLPFRRSPIDAAHTITIQDDGRVNTTTPNLMLIAFVPHVLLLPKLHNLFPAITVSSFRSSEWEICYCLLESYDSNTDVAAHHYLLGE